MNCKSCGRPIEESAELAEGVFEGMHWLCFHLAFEHPGDPDKRCLDPSCHLRRKDADVQLGMARSLHEEESRATELLRGKVVRHIRRFRNKELLVEFTDGSRLFVDHSRDELELSITTEGGS